jgi:hypothetical protein
MRPFGGGDEAGEILPAEAEGELEEDGFEEGARIGRRFAAAVGPEGVEVSPEGDEGFADGVPLGISNQLPVEFSAPLAPAGHSPKIHRVAALMRSMHSIGGTPIGSTLILRCFGFSQHKIWGERDRAGRDAAEEEFSGHEGGDMAGEAREELSGLPEPVAGAGSGGDGTREPDDGTVPGEAPGERGALAGELKEAGEAETVEDDL